MSDYLIMRTICADYRQQPARNNEIIDGHEKRPLLMTVIILVSLLFHQVNAAEQQLTTANSQKDATAVQAITTKIAVDDQAQSHTLMNTSTATSSSIALDLTNKPISQPAFSVRDNLLNIVFFLAMTITAIMGLAWLVHKTRLLRLTGQGRQILKIRHMLPLGVKQKIAVLQVGQQQILVGITHQQISHLMTLNEPIESPEYDEGFQKVLKRILTKDSDGNL